MSTVRRELEMLQNLTQISLVTGLQTTEPSVSARCQLDFNSKTQSLAASLAWAEPHSVQQLAGTLSNKTQTT